MAYIREIVGAPASHLALPGRNDCLSLCSQVWPLMNRRQFLWTSLAAAAAGPLGRSANPAFALQGESGSQPQVGVLRIHMLRSSERIYGQFLEHINHSIEDGLFAEQIRRVVI